MIAALDVDYRADVAVAACVLFESWEAESPSVEEVAVVHEVRDYVPGQFYLRELPALLAVLGRVHGDPSSPCRSGLPTATGCVTLDALLIDGYVWLDASGRPGLGAHLFRALEEKVPVIGVAKRAFAGSAHAVSVLRGKSARPLFVTAAGMDVQVAAAHVARMQGAHRIPTMLQRVDRLARSALVDPS